MPVTATITKEQRDGLYELVRHHLYSIDDLWTAFGRSRDYATAERLAIEFGEDFRLLADIGWPAYDDRASFELTMPPLDLTELIRRPTPKPRKSWSSQAPSERQAKTTPGPTNASRSATTFARKSWPISIREGAKPREGVQEWNAPPSRRAGRPGARHMRKHTDDGPLTASAIANRLARLAKDKKVHQG